MTIRVFDKDLNDSHEWAQLSIWQSIYQSEFPSLVSMDYLKEDGPLQRAGIDRVLRLGGGRTVRVQEKCRRLTYKDILLEYLHDEARLKPGWMTKPGQTYDYFTYVFLNSGRGYIFKFAELHKSWNQHSAQWLSRFKHVRSVNETYVTVSIAVPIYVLLSAAPTHAFVSFPPITGQMK